MVVPIPSYETTLVEALRAFDHMNAEDRALALAFLHIQLAHCALLERKWEFGIEALYSRVLGREA